ncbi:MAG: tRNA preQ1(34) S-adenosylmethionine ribosyltransferase-isomerase QueA [Rhodospirillaceae bacterium]|nr:tRNA preQ1(34) S-adenosylmethionine ribosyltransferase-isomerase QueA [Rhodospirillaceae bacterium]
MRVDRFDFELPEGLIAHHPASPRDTARLLEVGETLVDRAVSDLPRLLRPGDVMVFNDTKVIPSRLRGRRGTAGVEVTLHRRLDAGRWEAFARPARKLRPGDTVEFAADFLAEVEERGEGGSVTLRFSGQPGAVREGLERYGIMPLPPYIHRAGAGESPEDREDYQTVYARTEGAVAAPTAGLHFTERLLAAIDAVGVRRVFVTLHVGAGTFLPVKVEDTDDHRMHAEHGVVSADVAEAINTARTTGGRVIAVGTTSLRLLESASDAAGCVQPFDDDTCLFITPGYRFRTADALMTNFHLPRSTLFMLVAAFAGLDRMRDAYDHAVAAGYRFYSYGDACFLHRAQ